MPNITQQEPIRYQIDQASFDSSGLIIIPPQLGLDYSIATSVYGFAISGDAPANTQRAVAFSIEGSGSWVKLNSNGTTTALTTQAITVDSLLSEGNAPEDLTLIESVPSFVGERVGVAIALYAEDPDGDKPSLSIAGSALTTTTQKIKEETSPVFPINGTIKAINIQSDATEQGTATVTGRSRADSSDEWSEWASTETFIDEEVGEFQLKAKLTVVTPGSDTASMSKATMMYSSTGAGQSVNEVGIAKLVSLTEDWHEDITVINCSIRHAHLKDAKIRAYAALRPESTVTVGENIGTGTGAAQTYALTHTDGIKLSSVQVFVDGVRDYAFTADTVAGTVTLTAAAGSIVTANYEHGFTDEIWAALALQETLQHFEYDQSRFTYTSPDGAPNITVAALKIELETIAGTVSNELVGIGTSAVKTYKLNHIVKDQALTLFANGLNIQPGQYNILDAGDLVQILAPSGSTITANYEWISESPTVYRYIAVFA
jgi:hypothetical protein